MPSSIKTGLLHGVSFLAEDVASASPHSRLRSDAVAVALQSAISSIIINLENNDDVVVLDPNVAFLIVSMNSIKLGPVDALKKAKLIFVPIANFDTTSPEGGYHWTLLVLQRDSEGFWYPPVHIDSLVQERIVKSSATGKGSKRANSCNFVYAARATGLIMAGTPVKTSSMLNQENFDHFVVMEDDEAPVLLSGSPFDPLLVPDTPQQKNSMDCGIFIALAAKRVLELSKKNLSKSIFFAQTNAAGNDGTGKKKGSRIFRGNICSMIDWQFDQSTASKFKEDLFMSMSLALGKS